jgi:hypothetical protein
MINKITSKYNVTSFKPGGVSAFGTENCVLQAPGVAIHGASSAVVKTTNTFGVRIAGLLGVSVTTADTPSLATATDPNGNTVGTLAFDNGTVAQTTKSCRMYTLYATMNQATGAITLQWLAGFDFTKYQPVNIYSNIHFGDGTGAIVGYVYVKNETGSVFTPNTTDLDAGGGLTVSYADAFGYPCF